MLSRLFKTAPVIDLGSKDWILDTYLWAIEEFDLSVFSKQSQLILPTNEFYPGKVSSVHEMAQSVFNHTLNYAGMEAWPIKLVEPQQIQISSIPALVVGDTLRGDLAKISIVEQQLRTINISYNPAQVNQPQDLVSSFAQILSTILVMQAKTPPPGGKEFINQAIDLVACFMGFGVIFSNTAYQFRGGCGSCNNAKANRQASLSEPDTVYALAVFCVLKSITTRQVLPHLKSHLKKTFKDAVKELTADIKTMGHPLLLLSLNKIN